MLQCHILTLVRIEIKQLINNIARCFLSILIRYLINICLRLQHWVRVVSLKEIRFTNWIKQVRPIASAAVLARDEENQIG